MYAVFLCPSADSKVWVLILYTFYSGVVPAFFNGNLILETCVVLSSAVVTSLGTCQKYSKHAEQVLVIAGKLFPEPRLPLMVTIFE